MSKNTRMNTNAVSRDGAVRSSNEASVMDVERRDCVTLGGLPSQLRNEEELVEFAKPFVITKRSVWDAYCYVKNNRGASGVDRQSIEDFEINLKSNLYKIWNRLSSGSYFPPPVKQVAIPKKSGGERYLGIPTVSDRIAQTVVKQYLEPLWDPLFHRDSYGYRPNRSALDAVRITRERCWRFNWVVEFDIKGAFDHIDHELLMKAVRKHAPEGWLVLYIERWLKAPCLTSEGDLVERKTGTPQGGVISPLLMNLFMHYAFDSWMQRQYPQISFARYADDAVVHCHTYRKASELLLKIDKRLKECKLTMHQDKSKIVYCKDSKRSNKYENVHFTFLGFTFRPRCAKNRKGEIFTAFLPAASNDAKKHMRQKIRQWKIHQITNRSLKELAELSNPVFRGWINYYGAFYSSELRSICIYFHKKLTHWIRRKYRQYKRRRMASYRLLKRLSKKYPKLFISWQRFELT